ncbi:hypothetical protein UlMin_004195 [Ulmus minor]
MTKYDMNTQISSLEVSSRPETNITENSSPLIINHKLNGHNFLQWSQSVFMYICGRGKDEYLIGEVLIPAATNPKYRTWKIENHMVISWLINSMTTEVGENFLLYKIAKFKKYLELFEIETRLHELRQGELSVTQYFNILTRYWQ